MPEGKRADRGRTGQVRSILLSIIHNLGDAVMATAALDLLRIHFPQARIDLLAKKGVADIYPGLASVDNVYDYNAAENNKLSFFLSLMRTNKYDVFISFDRKSKPAIAARLSGIKWRIAPSHCLGHVKPKQRANFWYNQIIDLSADESYLAHETFQTVVRRAFGFAGQGRISLPPFSESQLKKAGALIPPDRHPVIGLSVKAERDLKNWAPERFAELLGRLAKTFASSFIYVTGTPGDRAYVDELLALTLPAKALNLAGETDLMTMAALAGRSDLFITLDTGAVHLAANSGLKRIIGLFCGTSPRIIKGAIDPVSIIWSGYDERSADPVEAAAAAQAKDRISVDVVFDEALRLLNSNDPQPNLINCRSDERLI